MLKLYVKRNKNKVLFCLVRRFLEEEQENEFCYEIICW